MSGRVRWERARVDRGLGSTDVCGFMAGGVAFEAVRYDDTAPTYATHYDRDGAPDADRTFRRRSDAKRWLLARAAGLAEAPRRVRVGPRGGSWSYVRRDAHTVWPPPGWHEVEEYIGDDGEVGVVLCERDRRRRGRGTSGPTARP